LETETIAVTISSILGECVTIARVRERDPIVLEEKKGREHVALEGRMRR
jgi:hypothetical protein